MLYLATLEPPVSAPALADQIGSTYQVAPTNGLSKRGPLLVEVLDELELVFTLDDEVLTTELELVLVLEDEVLTTELELVFALEDEVLTTELELVFTLEAEVLTTELELEDMGGQPATTPKGAGCAAQVDGAIQLLPFS